MLSFGALLHIPSIKHKQWHKQVMDVYSLVEDCFETSMTCFYNHYVKKMASVFALIFFSFHEEMSLILLVLPVEHIPVEECLAYCSLYTCENLPP